MTERVVVACGSASPKDPLWPAIALAESGFVEYLCFDRLAERTLALAQMRFRANSDAGQDEAVGNIAAALGPALTQGDCKVVGNFGAANPDAAIKEIAGRLTDNHHAGVKLGVIRGDDVRELAWDLDLDLPEWGRSVRSLGSDLVSANAYIGAEPIVQLLDQGAQFVVGGRIADSSLFVGAICHALRWDLDDWDRVAKAVIAGHLLECGSYVTGGNYADPPYRPATVRAHDVGFPIAEISNDEIVITKLPGTGGAVNEVTVKSQLGYEIGDPAAYLTPDLSADFSNVTVEEVGNDRVRIANPRGRPRPENLRVLVGADLGWRGEAEVTYGGPGCATRAECALEIIRAGLDHLAGKFDDIRYDIVGMTSLFGTAYLPDVVPAELRIRVAVRTRDREIAQRVVDETTYVTMVGPAGGGGTSSSVTPVLGVTPAYIPRKLVELETDVIEI